MWDTQTCLSLRHFDLCERDWKLYRPQSHQYSMLNLKSKISNIIYTWYIRKQQKRSIPKDYGIEPGHWIIHRNLFAKDNCINKYLNGIMHLTFTFVNAWRLLSLLTFAKSIFFSNIRLNETKKKKGTALKKEVTD